MPLLSDDQIKALRKYGRRLEKKWSRRGDRFEAFVRQSLGIKKLSTAHETWNARGEDLASVEARIHDGAPPEHLHDRATGYVKQMFKLFPWAEAHGRTSVVEVGPGVGYIMQAFMEHTGVAKVTGLDIAEGMIAHGKRRVMRDGLSAAAYDFVHYDGLRFPFADSSIDVFYSVAAIQHVPKPLAYNIFLEMMRCMKPGGIAMVQVLGWAHLKEQPESFADEVRKQMGQVEGHWHHFYSREELEFILGDGLQAPYFHVREISGSLWAAWCKDIKAFNPRMG